MTSYKGLEVRKQKNNTAKTLMTMPKQAEIINIYRDHTRLTPLTAVYGMYLLLNSAIIERKHR